FVNHAYERLCGYSSEDLLGRDSRELHRTDKNKDITEVINGHMKKGKKCTSNRTHAREIRDVINILPAGKRRTPGSLQCLGVD
ncbi:unnamed protein product, partial [Candidula unifasciata]